MKIAAFLDDASTVVVAGVVAVLILSPSPTFLQATLALVGSRMIGPHSDSKTGIRASSTNRMTSYCSPDWPFRIV